MRGLLAAVALCACARAAAAGDYERGWCAGYTMAARASGENRNHLRRLVHKPLHHEPRHTLVNRVTKDMLKAVDLYVVVPPLRQDVKVCDYYGPGGDAHCYLCPTGELVP